MNKTVGIALGSGSDRGFAHIGILKALLRFGIPINEIAGSSMGALVAAAYALYGDVAKLEALALSLSPVTLAHLIDVNNPTLSLLKGEKIRQFLRHEIFGEATFADTSIPLAIVATDLDSGLPYVFREGYLLDAVMASASIPGILPPVNREGKHLIDGGLVCAIPLEMLSSEIKIGVDLYAYSPKPQTHYRTSDVLERTYRIYLSKLGTLTHPAADANVMLLRPPIDEGLEALTFLHAKENIQIGEVEVEKNIDAIRNLIR
jgi:NTE family protein